MFEPTFGGLYLTVANALSPGSSFLYVVEPDFWITLHADMFPTPWIPCGPRNPCNPRGPWGPVEPLTPLGPCKPWHPLNPRGPNSLLKFLN